MLGFLGLLQGGLIGLLTTFGLDHLPTCKYNLLWMEKFADGTTGSPMVAASHLPGSVAFGWPVNEQMPSGLWEVDKFAQHDKCFLQVYSIAHWEVCSIQWLSPAEQWPHHNNHYKYEQIITIRGKPLHDGWAALPRAAARHGFWDCPLSTFKAFAPLVGCDLDGCEDLFDVLWALISTILEIDDEAVLQILLLMQDMVSQTNSEAVDMFMQMDVGVSQLPKEDADALKEQR